MHTIKFSIVFDYLYRDDIISWFISGCVFRPPCWIECRLILLGLWNIKLSECMPEHMLVLVLV